MPQKSYNKESKLFLLAFGKKNLTVTLKKGRKKATINKANYFYWYLEKKLNRDAQKGGNKKENTYLAGVESRPQIWRSKGLTIELLLRLVEDGALKYFLYTVELNLEKKKIDVFWMAGIRTQVTGTRHRRPTTAPITNLCLWRIIKHLYIIIYTWPSNQEHMCDSSFSF